jgi:hypothetical protein
MTTWAFFIPQDFAELGVTDQDDRKTLYKLKDALKKGQKLQMASCHKSYFSPNKAAQKSPVPKAVSGCSFKHSLSVAIPGTCHCSPRRRLTQ